MPKDMPRVGLRPFGEVMMELAGGDLESRLTAELGDVVRAVQATGKSGKLQITLTVVRDPKTIRIVAETKTTIPKEPTEATAFFVGEDGSLHKENPRQQTMFNGPQSVTGKDDPS